MQVKVVPAQRNELILITDLSPDLDGSGSQHLRDIIKCLNTYSRLRVVHANTESIDYHRSPSPTLDCSLLQTSAAMIHITLQTLFEETAMGDAEQTAYLHRIRINAFKFFNKFSREMESVKAHSTVAIFIQWPGMIFLWEAFALSNWRTVAILMDRYEPLFIAYPLATSSQALIRDAFDVALSHSDGLLTGSKKAEHALAKSLQVPCRAVMSVFRSGMTLPTARRSVEVAKLRRLTDPAKPSVSIALAGQIYAKDTIGLFLDALTTLNDIASTGGRSYSLIYYGKVSISNTYCQKCIVEGGSLEYGKLMNVMAESCVFGLVPYSFDASFATSAAFSFPSKLVAYIDAGVIPVYLGPRDSSVFDLLSEFELAGLCITTENPTQIAEQLVAIIAGDLIAIQAKLLRLSELFKPEYLQNCINDVFDRMT